MQAVSKQYLRGKEAVWQKLSIGERIPLTIKEDVFYKGKRIGSTHLDIAIDRWPERSYQFSLQSSMEIAQAPDYDRIRYIGPEGIRTGSIAQLKYVLARLSAFPPLRAF